MESELAQLKAEREEFRKKAEELEEIRQQAIQSVCANTSFTHSMFISANCQSSTKSRKIRQ